MVQLEPGIGRVYQTVSLNPDNNSEAVRVNHHPRTIHHETVYRILYRNIDTGNYTCYEGETNDEICRVEVRVKEVDLKYCEIDEYF